MRSNLSKWATSERKQIGNPQYNAEWVDRYLEVQNRSGHEYDVCCPLHGERHASMRINVAKGVFFCHGCGSRGTLPGLARNLRLTFNGNGAGVDMAGLLRKLDTLRAQTRHTPERKLYLPESELKRFDFPTAYWTDTRGFTPQTIASFDLGYDPMSDCVTIPIRDSAGNLIGFTKRYLEPDAPIRYRDPKGFDKGANLFGSWFADRDTRPYVVLTEGPLDCIKVWQAGHPSVAQFGSHLTPEQIRILKRMGVVTVILFYDNDGPGMKMIRAAHGWSKKMIDGKEKAVYDPQHDLRRFFIVKKVEYANTRAKDPGEMSDRDIDRLVSQSQIVYNRSKT